MEDLVGDGDRNRYSRKASSLQSQCESMLEHIDSISIMLLCCQGLYLLYHCHQWKGERTEFASWIKTEIAEDFKEFGGLLTEIADLLESSTDSNPPSNAFDPKEMLANLFISKVTDGLNSGLNGETQSSREIHPKIGETSIPEIQERLQSEGSSDDIHHNERSAEDDDGN